MGVKRLVATLVASATLGGVLLAQTPSNQVFRTGVDLLTVDVTVVDSRGRVVTDLRGPEFTVKIDGDERKVVSAEFIGYSADEKLSPPSPYYSTNAGRKPGRMIALVMDQGNSRAGTAQRLRQTATKFLDNLSPNDRVAYVAIPEPGPKVNFTDDMKLIRDALGMSSGTTGAPRGIFNMGTAEAMAVTDHSDPFLELALMNRLCGQFPQGTAERDNCEIQVRSDASRVMQEVRERTMLSVNSLRAILSDMSMVEGPKSLILMSEGLVLPGLAGEIDDLSAMAALAHVTIHVVLLDVPMFDAAQADMPPTPVQDRDMQVEGLEMLASMSRGALFRAVGASDAIFERLEREMAGYYLLGVEPLDSDRDNKRHKISVDVRRQGVTVRSRRQFLFTPASKQPTGDELLLQTLRSPVPATDLPIRLSSYALQEGAGPKVRVLLAAEIGAALSEASEVAVGISVIDRAGKVVAGGVDRKTLKPVEAGVPGPLEYIGSLLLDPGTYRLKMAALDVEGRRGSVEHMVEAWEMTGNELIVGDLMLLNAATPKIALQPTVEPRARGQLAAYLELYAAQAEKFAGTKVTLEIADEADAPPLASAPASLVASDAPTRRAAQAVVPLNALPPGEYVARAVVSSGDRIVGKLSRPFVVPAGGRAGAAPAAGGALATPAVALVGMPVPAKMDRGDLMKAEMLGWAIDSLEKGQSAPAPTMKAAFTKARAGQFAGTAMEALEAGDQHSAAMLKGLELLKAGQLDQAATQFRAAQRVTPTSAVAAFYLGACFAANGRDAEAATVWQTATPGDLSPLVVTTVADAWFRLGNAAKAVAPLKQGVSRWPDNDDMRRRLGLALAAAGEMSEAVSTLDPYIERHPADYETTFVAIQALFVSHSSGRPVKSADADRALAARYAKVYAAAKGPNQPLVVKWAEALAK